MSLIGNAEMTELFKCPKKGQVCCAAKSKIQGMMHRNDTIPPQVYAPPQPYPPNYSLTYPPNYPNAGYQTIQSQPTIQNPYAGNYPNVQQAVPQPQPIPQQPQVAQAPPHYTIQQQPPAIQYPVPVAVPPNAFYTQPNINNVIPPVYPTQGKSIHKFFEFHSKGKFFLKKIFNFSIFRSCNAATDNVNHHNHNDSSPCLFEICLWCKRN